FASAILCGNDPADVPYHLTRGTCPGLFVVVPDPRRRELAILDNRCHQGRLVQFEQDLVARRFDLLLTHPLCSAPSQEKSLRVWRSCWVKIEHHLRWIMKIIAKRL